MENIQAHVNEARRTGEIEFFIEKRSEDCVVSRMPISRGALNPFGRCHGDRACHRQHAARGKRPGISIGH
jgi:hypothetical protein